MTITFRRLVAEDFPLLGRWLTQPHVARWWNHETSADAVARDFGPAARGEEPAEDFLTLLDGQPIGLVQRAFLADYPEYLAEYAAVVDVPDGAVTLDYLIGDPARIGHGLGTTMIAAALERTWTDLPAASCVLIAVVAGNPASWTALQKAGLSRVGEGDMVPDNPIDAPLHYLYRLDRPAGPPTTGAAMVTVP